MMYEKTRPKFLKMCLICHANITDEDEWNKHRKSCGCSKGFEAARPAVLPGVTLPGIVKSAEPLVQAAVVNNFATYDVPAVDEPVIVNTATEPVEPMGEDPNPPKETLVHAIREMNGMGNEPPKSHSDRRNVGRPKKFGSKE